MTCFPLSTPWGGGWGWGCMKLLVIVSSLDLTQPFSATPAWWQLMKGLYEIGVDVIATPYQGPAIETPWWRAAPNPAKLEGDAFKLMRDGVRRFTGLKETQAAGTQLEGESLPDKVVRRVAQTVIAPRWRRHVDRCSGSSRTSTRCW